MIIAFLCGGLGNQMFQYAMARRLAHARSVELKLDLREYGGVTDRPPGLEAFTRRFRLDQFCIAATVATQQEIARFQDPYSSNSTGSRLVRQFRRFKPDLLLPRTDVREKSFRFDPAMLDRSGDAYLHGFWQSHKYFADSASTILADFQPKDPQVAKYAEEYVERLRTLGRTVVSLHVRRGDLAFAAEHLKIPGVVHGPPVGVDYIQAAIARFPADSRFLVFSDTPKDIEWCRQNIRAGQVHFSEGHNDIQDMVIMSACDHHIIANSTFSWWAAWLNQRPGRRVISPRQWTSPDWKAPLPTDDLLPADWELI